MIYNPNVICPNRDGSTDPVLFTFLHGLGGNPSSWRLYLETVIPEDYFLFLPAGPHSLGRNSYAWFKQIHETKIHTPLINKSVNHLHNLLERFPELYGVTPRAKVLAGYSQGGTMSLTHPLRHPTDVDFSVCFSGYLPNSVPIVPKKLEHTKFLWCHGLEDWENNYSWATKSVPDFQKAGADLTFRSYDNTGHVVTDSMLDDMLGWLESKGA